VFALLDPSLQLFAASLGRLSQLMVLNAELNKQHLRLSGGKALKEK
jgi:hypothetical protein